MLQTPSPAVSRRWLAFEVKRLRRFAGLSQADVARAIGSQVPKISLIEKGHRNVQERDLRALLPLFDVPEDRWDEYFTAVRHAQETGWWETYDEHTVPKWLQRFIGLEQGVRALRTYEHAVFPGLLQTPQYAHAVLRHFSTPISHEKIERLVELRMRRQDAVWRADNPLTVWAIVDEAVLRRVVGNAEIMRRQLEHVADIAKRYDHITLQVVPFDSDGTYEAAYGAFAVLHFGWPNDPGVVYLEHRWNAEFLEKLDALDKYSVLFNRLGELALSSEESIDRLTANS